MSEDLAKILSGESLTEESTAEEKGVETPIEKEAVETEAKDDPKVEKEESEETTSSEEEEEAKNWKISAVKDERRKRQEAERKAKELEAEIAALKQPKSQEEEAKRPDVLDDQEGAFKHTEDSFQKALWKQKVDLTSEIMREKHQDFDEIVTHFANFAGNDPKLLQEFRNSANPAKFAYETGLKQRKLAEYSDPEFEKKFEEKIRAKISAELNKSDSDVEKEAEAEKPKTKLPPSFSTATSAKNGDKFPEPKTLDELFPPLNQRK